MWVGFHCPLQSKLQMTVPAEYMCPITNDVMRDPVIDSEGHTYERAAIVQWLHSSSRSPITRNPMTVQDLKPNRALAEAIGHWVSASSAPPPSAPPPPPTPYYNAMTGPVYVCPNEYPYQILVDVAPTVVQSRPAATTAQPLQPSTPQGRALRVLLSIAITIILLVFLFRAL